MLKFLIYTRIKHLFAGRKSRKANVLRIILLIITIIYGIGFSCLVDYFSNTRQNIPAILTGSLNLFAWLIILLRNIFPVYRPISYPFLIYPVPVYKQFVLQLLLELLSPLFVYIAVFFGVLLLSGNYNFTDLIVSALFIVQAFSTEPVVRCLLEKKKKLLWLFIVFINIAVMFYIMKGLGDKLFGGAELAVMAIASVINFSGIYLSARNFPSLPAVAGSIYRSKGGNSTLSYYNLLLLRRNSLKITFVAACVFKVVLFWAGPVRDASTESGLIPVLTAIGLSPALLFTYLFNNYYGYAREIWYYQARVKPMKHVFAGYIGSLALPVFIDLLISIGLWTKTGISFRTFAFSYAIDIVLFWGIGFITSFLLPVKISGVISFKKLRTNTNFLVALMNIVFAGVILNLVSMDYKLAIIICSGVVVPMAWGMNYLLTKRDIHISVFKKLFGNYSAH